MDIKEQKEYDERIKSRVLLLQKIIKEGTLKFVYDKQLEKSLLACRYDANGDPDLSTVDGLVRSMAILAEHFDYRQKVKEAISLSEIQNRYFEFIDGNFDFFYNKMLELKLTPHEAANRIAYGDHSTVYLQEKIKQFLYEIVKFWDTYAEPAYIHVEDTDNSLKAVFGGDLFPANNENIASKCGIYTDTIILPCPFIRSRFLFDKWDKNQQVYYLLKHALNILQYKSLAVFETKFPIIVILPDKEMMSKEDLKQVTELGDRDALFHASKIFNHSFKNLDELLEYAKSLDTVEKVISEIKDTQRVLFDSEYSGSLQDQIKKETIGQSSKLLGTNNPGIIVASLGIGRMSVCNELLLKSLRLRGTPLIDAPTSWQYFKWKLEYDAERTHPDEDFNSLHIVNGLTGLKNSSLQWIGKIPPEGLIELRKSGALNEIRAIISEGIDELSLANSLDFNSTTKRVFENLSSALIRHNENIKILKKKKWKIAGKDIGSWLVMGSIEIASACTGTPLYGLSTVLLNQLIDAPKIKDLPKSFHKIKDVAKQRKDLERSPIGLIFKYKK
jgi:hypothetical protein